MILTINAGSATVKLAVFDPNTLDKINSKLVTTLDDAFAWLKNNLSSFKITSIGHRIVHGGNKFFDPIMLNAKTINELKELIPLAPLHQPYNLDAIEALMREFPKVPQVGCFDTAFHKTQLPLAKEFAIPDPLTNEGVIRYGFHGLSYEYIASVLPKEIGPIAMQKVIVAHLGNGASMCAMHNLQSQATSMGFSALDGLMMGTRAGSIDPGVLLYLLQEKHYSADELSKFLYEKCGLLGVSGITNDMQKLLDSDTAAAKKAIDLFCFRAACEFGRLSIILGGCDALVFTGGIGENSAEIRERICKWLAHHKLLVRTIKTNEELIIAQHTKRVACQA